MIKILNVTWYKIAFFSGLFFIAGFALWRKWREDYTEDEILDFILSVGIWAMVGGWLAKALHTGQFDWSVTGWGMILAGYGSVIWYSRRKKWNVWETLDTVTPLFAWLWALTGWMDGPVQAVFAWAGLVVVAVIKKCYRNWRWYKSGRMGLPGLGFLAWFALGQIIVAFGVPGGIYWGGLKAGQWAGSYLLAFVTVAIYIRSGRKIKERLGGGGRRDKDEKE